jgi:hypothetical protein
MDYQEKQVTFTIMIIVSAILSIFGVWKLFEMIYQALQFIGVL